MDNKNEGVSFNYTYSAKEQEELKKIRQKYMPDSNGKEDKMERVRRLDKGANDKAQIISLALGIIGALILGTGLSMILTDIASALGIFATILGVIIGVIGGALAGIAYPAYSYVLKRERAKIAPEIIRLTDELIK